MNLTQADIATHAVIDGARHIVSSILPRPHGRPGDVRFDFNCGLTCDTSLVDVLTGDRWRTSETIHCEACSMVESGFRPAALPLGFEPPLPVTQGAEELGLFDRQADRSGLIAPADEY